MCVCLPVVCVPGQRMAGNGNGAMRGNPSLAGSESHSECDMCAGEGGAADQLFPLVGGVTFFYFFFFFL